MRVCEAASSGSYLKDFYTCPGSFTPDLSSLEYHGQIKLIVFVLEIADARLASNACVHTISVHVDFEKQVIIVARQITRVNQRE